MELGKTKAKIERYAKENNVDVQVAWDSFFFDEFLHRISLCDYKDKYVFKGGFYLQKVLGVSTRSTMDLDFKYSCVEMSDKILLKEINEICGLNQTSNIVFSCLGIEDIRAEMKYSGKTVRIEAHLAKSGRHQILNKDVFGENKLQINNLYIAKMNFWTIL